MVAATQQVGRKFDIAKIMRKPEFQEAMAMAERAVLKEQDRTAARLAVDQLRLMTQDYL